MTEPISRTELLDSHIARETLAGASLVTRAGNEAVFEFADPGNPAPTNHILHAILTIFSCGLWLLIWGGRSADNALKRRSAKVTRYTIKVDEHGRSWTIDQGESEWKPFD